MKNAIKTSFAAVTFLATAAMLSGCKGKDEGANKAGKPRRGPNPPADSGIARPDGRAFRPASDGGTAAVAPGVPGRLSRAQHKIFWGSTAERAPRRRARDAHFYVGNENELYLFYDHIKDLGGGYLGVGSDQAYLFIGWMRAEFSWLSDYDAQVVDLHRVYHAFFLKAATPDAFLELWSAASEAEAEKVIKERYAQDPGLNRYLKVYRKARREVHPRLRKVRRTMVKSKTPCYLTHRKMYGLVRKVVRRKRVRPMVGDLRGPKTLVGAGDASRKLAVPIRVYYPSNAEEYWRWFPDQYRRNIFALNFDKRSVVIRLLTRSRAESTYAYHVQPALNFVAGLRLRRIGRVHQFKRKRVRKLKNAALFIVDSPTGGGRPWKARAR